MMTGNARNSRIFSTILLHFFIAVIILSPSLSAYEYPVSDRIASASDRVVSAVAQVPGIGGLVGTPNSNAAFGNSQQQQQQRSQYGSNLYEVFFLLNYQLLIFELI